MLNNYNSNPLSFAQSALRLYPAVVRSKKSSKNSLKKEHPLEGGVLPRHHADGIDLSSVMKTIVQRIDFNFLSEPIDGEVDLLRQSTGKFELSIGF